jgi:hypothetical protein
MTLTGLQVIKKQGLRICRFISSYKTENQGKWCHEYQKQNAWRSLKQFADFLTASIIYNRGKYIGICTIIAHLYASLLLVLFNLKSCLVNKGFGTVTSESETPEHHLLIESLPPLLSHLYLSHPSIKQSLLHPIHLSLDQAQDGGAYHDANAVINSNTRINPQCYST